MLATKPASCIARPINKPKRPPTWGDSGTQITGGIFRGSQVRSPTRFKPKKRLRPTHPTTL